MDYSTFFLDFILVINYNYNEDVIWMGIIYLTNKKTGIKYAYDNKAYWDPEKKQSRSKRKLIGRVDPVTGEIVATRPYKKQTVEPEQKVQQESVPFAATKRHFIGATYLLDQIGKATGVEADLKTCFPQEYKQILSLAYYLILEETNSLSRFSHWHKLHHHPYGKDIDPQRSRELLQGITEEQRMSFFAKQGNRRIEDQYWGFDTTSISSYCDTLEHEKMGKNKENDRLPQFNLAVLFGEASGLPFYYRKLSGNICDVKTIRQLKGAFDGMDYQNFNVILDPGFYSQENMDDLYQHHQKFLIGLRLNLSYVKEVLDKEKDNLGLWSNLNPQFGTYGLCRPIDWDYSQERTKKGEVLTTKRQAYLHLYYNPEKAAKDRADQNEDYNKLYYELTHHERKEYHTKDYAKYFDVVETPKHGIKVTPKEEAMKAEMRNYGYFALLSNDVKEPFEALSLHHSKDIAEKGFSNLKDRLNFATVQVSSELALDGKLFIGFIALIYLSYLKKKMEEAKLFDRWTLQGVLDEVDLIEVVKAPGSRKIIGDVTKTQKELFQSLEITPPS